MASIVHKKKKDIIYILYRDERTVFRLIDVAMLTGESDRQSLGKRLNYYVKTGKLQNPRKGIYVKPDYDPEELACRIYTPSYISLEYVLQKNGIIFQYDRQITVVSYLSRHIKADELTIRYRKIKGEVLVNKTGLVHPSPYVTMALPERAFLDLLYLDPYFYFDNPKVLKKSLIMKMLPEYQSKALSQRVKKILYHG